MSKKNEGKSKAVPRDLKETHELGPSPLDERQIIIRPRQVASIGLEIRGTSLIQNAFSQKAIEQMLRKHMGLSITREKKNPRKVIEEAIVRNEDDVICQPSVGFKAAMITASSSNKLFDRAKTKLKTSLFIEGEGVPITFERMVPRMDMVRTSGMSRTPDVRFRPNFRNWSARLIVQYAESILQVETVVDLLQAAGSVGVGEWRPEKMGVHGRFEVVRAIESAKELAEVRAACSVPLKQPQIPDWAMDADINPALLAKMFSPGADGGDSTAADSEEGDEAEEGVAE